MPNKGRGRKKRKSRGSDGATPKPSEKKNRAGEAPVFEATPSNPTETGKLVTVIRKLTDSADSQTSEQTGSATNPTEKTMAAKEPTLQEVMDAISKVQSDVSVLREGQDSIKTDIQSIRQDHASLKEKLEGYQDSLDFAHREITDLKTRTSGQQSDINILREENRDLNNKFNELNVRLRRTEAGVTNLNTDTDNLQDQINVLDPTSVPTKHFPYDRTVVVYNVPFEEGEIVFELATELVSAVLGLELVIVRACREGVRDGYNGIMKIEFESEHDMNEVLKVKRRIGWHPNPTVRRFYMRQSQPKETRRTRRCLDGLLSIIDPEGICRFNDFGELVENRGRGRSRGRGRGRGRSRGRGFPNGRGSDMSRGYGSYNDNTSVPSESENSNWMSTRMNQHIRYDSDDDEHSVVNSDRGRGRGMFGGRGRGDSDGSDWMSSSGRGNRPPGTGPPSSRHGGHAGHNVMNDARASSTGVAGSGRGNRPPGTRASSTGVAGSGMGNRLPGSGRGNRPPGNGTSDEHGGHAGHNVTRDARAGTTGAASSGWGHRAPGDDDRGSNHGDHVDRNGRPAGNGSSAEHGGHAGHNVTRDARAGTTGAASSGRGYRALDDNLPGDHGNEAGRNGTVSRAGTTGVASSGRGNRAPGNSNATSGRGMTPRVGRQGVTNNEQQDEAMSTDDNADSIYADADNDTNRPVGGDSFNTSDYF